MTRVKWLDIIKRDFNDLDLTLIKNKLLSIVDRDIRVFVIMLYLFGCRISELCEYKQDNKIKRAVRKEDGEVLKVNRKTVYDWFETLRIRMDGVKKKDFKIVTRTIKGVDYKFFTCVLRNEKNRKEKTKLVYAPYDKEFSLVNEVLNYIETFGDEEVIFPYSRKVMYNRFKKEAPQFFYPHFLRNLRINVLITIYGFTDFEIQDFMGWSNTKPLNNYRFLKSINTGMGKMIGDAVA